MSPLSARLNVTQSAVSNVNHHERKSIVDLNLFCLAIRWWCATAVV
jgi:hypothetical protein